MNLVQLAQSISISIAAVGVVFAGIGYLWGQIFAGKNKATTEDYNLLNTRLNSLQNTCDSQQKELADLHLQVGRLQGGNEEKEKKIKELTELLQNRDPGLVDFMKFITESTKGFQQALADSSTAFKRIHDRLDLIDGKFNQILSEGKIK